MQRDCPRQSRAEDRRQRTEDKGQKPTHLGQPPRVGRLPRRGGRTSILRFISVLCPLSSVLFLSASGCQRSKTSAPAVAKPRWDKVTLTIACPEGPARLLFDRAGAAWARQSGATIRCVTPSADPAADVLVLRAAELPQWAAAGKLLPLDDKDKDWLSLLGPYRLHLLRWENTVYAVPLLAARSSG